MTVLGVTEADLVREARSPTDPQAPSRVARLEHALARQPELLEFAPDGAATLRTDEGAWAAGRFEVLSLGELERRVKARGPPHTGNAVRLSVLEGAGALSDIGLLQAAAAPGSLFQVASQFNCLEAPDALLVPVARYFRDPTQGPRASISAFPGTLLRHYAAPRGDGSRFTQTEGDQLNLLAAFCTPGVARVESGYLMTQNIASPKAFLEALERDFARLCVGVHDGVEVVFGGGWTRRVARVPAPRVAQVFTSTWAGGGYSDGSLGAHHEATLRLLQRGAYLGTLLAASALGLRRVVLTLIGGGVFDNPKPLIWEAVFWAMEQLALVAPAPLDVIVNARTELDEAMRATVRERVGQTGGQWLRASDEALEVDEPAGAR